jgi:hypothetical protein
VLRESVIAITNPRNIFSRDHPSICRRTRHPVNRSSIRPCGIMELEVVGCDLIGPQPAPAPVF